MADRRYDWETVHGLLSIIEKVAQHGTKMHFLRDAAMKELEAMRPEPEEKPEPLAATVEREEEETTALKGKRRSLDEGGKDAA